jgi:hypothetical protein
MPLLLLLPLLRKMRMILIFSVPMMRKLMRKPRSSRLNVLLNITPRRPTSPRPLPRLLSLLMLSLGMMRPTWKN